jgi:hypothetical protein
VHVRGCRLVSRLALGLLLVSAPTLAQMPVAGCPEGDATACGRRHFEAGTEAFERGDFTTAASHFESAIVFRAHPVIRFNLALSLAKLGRPSAAIEQLRLIREDTAADKELKARAEREQRGAEQALARVTFRLADPTRESVELDGAIVTLGAQSELTLDPGSHHVRVISGSSVVLDQEVELSPGERVELRVGERSRRIDIVVVPEATPKAPPVTRPVAPLAPVAPQGLSPAWFYAGVGVTAVLGGLTLWSGLDTQSALDDYESDLPSLDQSQADERVRDGHARERRTNLLLAGSLVAGAGTAVLGVWLVDFRGSGRAAVGLTPSGVRLSGSF